MQRFAYRPSGSRGPRRLALLLALPLLLAACGGEADAPRVRLATSTSARDTGLLDWVLPEVERRAGLRVDVIAVGTGQALELSRRGDADLVLVHDRAREDAFVKEGWGLDRRDVMWNDFVVVGPPADPAGIMGGRDAVAAFKRLAETQAAFISRGDDSGTHAREKSLWKAAELTPAWPGYRQSGQGQGPTLLLAGEQRGYTLTDRATYAFMRKQVELEVLIEGDRRLANPYGAILVNPAKNPGVNAEGARAVLDWLTSPEGQARIGAFRIEGQAVFHPGALPK